MWSLRHARNAGMRAHSLVAPLNGAHFAGRPLLRIYAKARVKTVSDELGVQALDVSHSMRSVLKALRSNQQVLAAIDVPEDSADASVETHLLNQDVRMPRALIRLAASNAIPVTIFIVGLDTTTGRRRLRILTLPSQTNTETLAQNIFLHLDQAIRAEPWAWHFWSQANRIFNQNNQANGSPESAPTT
jgi:lauroyl/myristoyl acyltransferase